MKNGLLTTEKLCPFCGKRYSLTIYEQIPGFRDTEEEVCPYCNETIRTSMEYEFHTDKVEKE